MIPRFLRLPTLGGLALLIAAAAAAPSSAQQIGPSAQPEFRDPKTGQIWTPENVGGKSGPNTPADRAFDPQAQTTTVRETTVQAPSVQVVGSVPITAGPSVPIAVIGNANLTVIPSQRWQVTLTLDNNSAATISPVVECRFANGANTVETARASLPPVAGGQRVGFVVYGPPSSLFVNSANCALLSPA
ncbi:hypothetical protein [Reyranella sp.]|uniref:hypothetical protein n=1 Tax=Reyranella sp. TaxID=1929291 RepID=UPI003BAC0069